MSPEQSAALEQLLGAPGGLGLEQADKMVENVVWHVRAAVGSCDQLPD
jgi:hypothetical protein